GVQLTERIDALEGVRTEAEGEGRITLDLPGLRQGELLHALEHDHARALGALPGRLLAGLGLLARRGFFTGRGRARRDRGHHRRELVVVRVRDRYATRRRGRRERERLEDAAGLIRDGPIDPLAPRHVARAGPRGVVQREQRAHLGFRDALLLQE